MDKHKFSDLDKFSKKLAKLVARESGYTMKELRAYIRPSNVKGIVKNYVEYDEVENMFVITEEAACEASEEILDWLVGVELAKLAADDVLDAYWDDETNQMVFKSKR